MLKGFYELLVHYEVGLEEKSIPWISSLLRFVANIRVYLDIMGQKGSANIVILALQIMVDPGHQYRLMLTAAVQ